MTADDPTLGAASSDTREPPTDSDFSFDVARQMTKCRDCGTVITQSAFGWMDANHNAACEKAGTVHSPVASSIESREVSDTEKRTLDAMQTLLNYKSPVAASTRGEASVPDEPTDKPSPEMCVLVRDALATHPSSIFEAERAGNALYAAIASLESQLAEQARQAKANFTLAEQKDDQLSSALRERDEARDHLHLAKTRIADQDLVIVRLRGRKRHAK